MWDNKSNTEWAGKKKWMEAKKKKSQLEEKYKFVTFILSRIKLFFEHRKNKNKEIGKNVKVKKHPET